MLEYRNSKNDREAFIEEAEAMIEKYGWENRTVMPYNDVTMKITDIINHFKDYDRCTKGSQEYLVGLINGLGSIMNSWEKYENEPKIKIKMIRSGAIRECRKEIADEFIKDGFAVLA